MHLLARLAVTTAVALGLLGFCSAPARAQVVPAWLPMLTVKVYVRVIEFSEVLREEIRERLDRNPLRSPRFVPPPPPVILPVIDPAGEPPTRRAVAPRPPLQPELVP